MYQNHFGLKELPFNITPDPRYLFRSPTHEEALQHMRYGIREKKGFIVLTGEVGCGKTTLSRALLSELDANPNYQTALLINTQITETQLIRSILSELGYEPRKRSKGEMLEALNYILLEKISQNKNIVLFIDEAQNLSFEVLEQVRLLSNLEAEDQKLMQIVLMGQPELDAKLEERRLRQLRQRILVYYHLRPLNRQETGRYIEYRLTQAGAAGEFILTPSAIRLIHRKARGIPRLINNLCDKSMLSAYVRESDLVERKDVRRAAKEMKNMLAF